MDPDARIKLLIGDLAVRLCVSQVKNEQQEIRIAELEKDRKAKKEKSENKT